MYTHTYTHELGKMNLNIIGLLEQNNYLLANVARGNYTKDQEPLLLKAIMDNQRVLSALGSKRKMTELEKEAHNIQTPEPAELVRMDLVARHLLSEEEVQSEKNKAFIARLVKYYTADRKRYTSVMDRVGKVKANNVCAYITTCMKKEYEEW